MDFEIHPSYCFVALNSSPTDHRNFVHWIFSRILHTSYTARTAKASGGINGPGGVLPYIRYIGMCRPKRLGFVLVWKRVYILNIFVWNWVWLSGERSRKLITYCSSQQLARVTGERERETEIKYIIRAKFYLFIFVTLSSVQHWCICYA